MHILCVYLHQIARGIVLFLVNNLYEKRITESLEGRNFGAFFALLVICTRVKTLHMKNALVFTQSDALFPCTLSPYLRACITFCWP